MLNFSYRSQQPKMKKKFLLNAKNRIHSVQRDEVPEILFFVNYNIGWRESGKAILQVSVAVFRALSKYFFGQRWLSLP